MPTLFLTILSNGRVWESERPACEFVRVPGNPADGIPRTLEDVSRLFNGPNANNYSAAHVWVILSAALRYPSGAFVSLESAAEMERSAV